MTRTRKTRHGIAAASVVASMSLAGTAWADQVFLDDVIIDGSLCVGFDCVNGESFGFDTIRLKENNLRIRAVDTSNSASFPTVDWQITFNETSNGGQNKFSIDDIDNSRTPFTIEAGARSNSIYVSDSNKVGFGTNIPVTDLHVKQGNTPTLRLEQDGSSGFSPQTWDIAGNEANFFIRDVTNGSALPVRVKPGAPTNAISINNNGYVGMGIQTASTPLHVRRTDGAAQLKIEEASGTTAPRGLLSLVNNGRVYFALEDTSIPAGNFSGRIWNMQNDTGNYTITTAPGGTEFLLTPQGDLTISGDFISGTTTLAVPDYVFAADYELRPLSEVRAFITAKSHLPDVPSAAEIADGGLNMGQMQMALLRKVEELTLYTLHQEDRITALNAEIEMLRTQDAR